MRKEGQPRRFRVTRPQFARRPPRPAPPARLPRCLPHPIPLPRTSAAPLTCRVAVPKGLRDRRKRTSPLPNRPRPPAGGASVCAANTFSHIAGPREMRKRRTKKEMRAQSTVETFDPDTVAMLIKVVHDAWLRLPVGQTSVTRPMLAARILKAARAGERDPAKLRAQAIAGSIEATLHS
jgi:hypothetical protein